MKKLLNTGLAVAILLGAALASAQVHDTGAGGGANINITAGSINCQLSGASGCTITPNSTLGIVGTTTNDSAVAGAVGEMLKATVVAGSGVSQLTATPINITSLSLTPGDWEVTGACNRTLTGVTATIYGCSLSGTTGTLSTQPAFTAGNLTCDEESFVTQAATFGTTVTGRYDTRIGPIRCKVTAAATTIFLVVGDTFSAGTMTTGVFGTIKARRVR